MGGIERAPRPWRRATAATRLGLPYRWQLWLLNPAFGPINQLLAIVGIPGPTWMVEEWGARFAVVLMMLWQIGEGLVVCLTALGDIPREVLEQAASDGAGRWQTLWSVILPLLAPVLLILLFRDTIYTECGCRPGG